MSDSITDQGKLINLAIKKAGSIDALSQRLGVCRQTIFKWRKGVHEMKMSRYLELSKWVG
jgi:transposase-like protein